MATIRKRGKSWQAIVKFGRNGRNGLKRKTFATRREAVAWAESLSALHRKNPDGLTTVPTDNQTLADFLWLAVRQKARTLQVSGTWETWLLAGSPHDLQQWTYSVRSMVANHSIFGRSLVDITGSDLANYFQKRLHKCTLSTLRRTDINLISAAYRIAGQKNISAHGLRDFQVHFARSILRAPTRTAVRGGSKRSRRVLPPAEVAILDATTQPQLGLAVIISIETALRQSELCRTDWLQVDWEQKELWMPGEKTKNRHARTILLTARALTALENLRQLYPLSERLFGPWKQTALRSSWQKLKMRFRIKIEASTATLRLADDFGISQNNEELTQARAMLALAPILRGVRWHDFRHEAISRWLDSGMPAHVASAMSGHNTATVLSNYSHARERAARPYLDILDKTREAVR